jgi:hypothetical protein
MKFILISLLFSNQLIINNLSFANEIRPSGTEGTLQNYLQQAYHKASNTGSGDRFANVIAISGETIVVGAPYEDSNAQGINADGDNDLAPESGAVYVYERINEIWQLQAYLKSSNSESIDLFGFSVAIEGDTLVVGAPYEDSNSTGVNGDQLNNLVENSGALYVFTRNAGIWTQSAYIKASNTGIDDHFGYSVGISADTIVTGARNENSNATGINGDQTDNSFQEAGAAYVFTRNSGVWSQQAYLKASNTGNADNFGISIAISGDSILVGAYLESSNATGVDGDGIDDSAFASGAGYVFTRLDDDWKQRAYLKAINTETGDLFGRSVSISNDLVAIGAVGEDSNAIGVNGDFNNNSSNGSGAVYIYQRSSGEDWKYHSYIKSSNNDIYDNFGVSVSVNNSKLVVGSDGEASNATGLNGNQFDNEITGSGAAYVFNFNNNNWMQQDYVKASNTGFFNFFGYSVAISDKLLVVGANQEPSNSIGVYANQYNDLASQAGAIYVFNPKYIFINGFE